MAIKIEIPRYFRRIKKEIRHKELPTQLDKITQSEWLNLLRSRSQSDRSLMSQPHRTELNSFGEKVIVESGWGTSRGVDFLTSENNRYYDSLPSSVKDDLKSLSDNSTWLDIACGVGKFQVSAKNTNIVKPNVRTVGLDMFRHGDDWEEGYPGVERLDEFIEADLFNQTQLYDHLRNKCELVTATTFLYHLDDPVLGIRAMLSCVSNSGTLIANTFPRLVSRSGKNVADTLEGRLESKYQDAKIEEVGYFNKNGYLKTPTGVRSDGRIVPPGELIEFIANSIGVSSYQYDYPDGTTIGTLLYSGRIILKNPRRKSLNNIFLGRLSGHEVYLLAKDETEQAMFQANGFICIEDIYQTLQSNNKDRNAVG